MFNPTNGLDCFVFFCGQAITNVVPACYPCNRMKNELPTDDFSQKCEIIVERMELRFPTAASRRSLGRVAVPVVLHLLDSTSVIAELG